MEHSLCGERPEEQKLKILKIRSYCKICKRFDCKDDCLEKLKLFNEGVFIEGKIANINTKFFLIILLKIPLLLMIFFLIDQFSSPFHVSFLEIGIDVFQFVMEGLQRIIWLIENILGNIDKPYAPYWVSYEIESIVLIFLNLTFAFYMGFIFYLIVEFTYQKEMKAIRYYRQIKKFRAKDYRFDYSLYSEPEKE